MASGTLEVKMVKELNNGNNVIFSTTLKFPSGGEKEYRIELVEISHVCGDDIIDTLDEVSVWSEGGTNHIDPALIVKDWNAAMRRIMADIPEEYLDKFVEDAKAAIRYEILDKNSSSMELDLSERFGKLKLKIRNKRRRNRHKRDRKAAKR